MTPVSIEINEASHTLATLNGGRLMLTGDTTTLATDGAGKRSSFIKVQGVLGDGEQRCLFQRSF